MTGIGSAGRGADDAYARFEEAGRSSGSIFSGLDRDTSTREVARRLAGQPRITASDVEGLIRDAADYGGVMRSEKQAIAGLLGDHHAKFDADARDALLRWLGPDAPALPPRPGPAPSTATTTAPTNPNAVRILATASGTSGALASRSSADSTRRPGFDADATLARVAAGQATLEQGARGTGVAEVQRALLDLDIDLGASGADGQFGPGMKAAVQRFQRSQGLPADGVIGRGTLDALERAAKPDPRANLGAPLVQGAVGPRAANRISDVKAVQERLATLGFYGGRINGRWDGALDKALRVFDAAAKGETSIAHGGREYRDAATLSPGEETERWLRAQNAPRWSRIGAGGTGWTNADRDGYSYSTSWLQETISRAGARFDRYIATHPGTPLMHTNDASTRTGGDNRDHDTHESGLSLDVSLGAGQLTFRHRDYDREATWAQVRAFLDDPSVTRVLFNDPELIRRADAIPAYAGRLQTADGHDHHLHVDIRPPARVDA
jgi:peptidoglycan hydrolase-like protein with peptidoglycan-binding domain